MSLRVSKSKEGDLIHLNNLIENVIHIQMLGQYPSINYQIISKCFILILCSIKWLFPQSVYAMAQTMVQ